MTTSFGDEIIKTVGLAGEIVVESSHFESLENAGGEEARRDVSIYLPPNYKSSDDRYPVIYFLPGFGTTHAQIMDAVAPIVDASIVAARMRSVILVVPDHYTSFKGSYFSDSVVNGNWVRFTVNDVVSLVDGRYRTYATRDSRGLAGWSSGAYGAVKIGMLHPEVFGSVYSMSPGILALTDEFGPDAEAFKRAGKIDSRKQLVTGWDELFANLVIAMGRAFSPNPENPPFLADLPYAYKAGRVIVDEPVLEKWNRHIPIKMLSEYADNFRSLNAFKLEWGRNDEYQNVVTGCRIFSQKLEELGIEHEAEEYLGTHSDKIFVADGRIATDMLPFFDRHLRNPPGEGASR